MLQSKKDNSDKFSFAEESYKTRKAREKLKKKLCEIDQMITAEALKEKTIEIHRWIERHSSDRAILKTKSISLFDENQNTASVSKKISEIAEQLKGEDKALALDSSDKAKDLLMALSDVNLENSYNEQTL